MRKEGPPLSSVTTQGIVLRHADYREHDRMLTLLSPGLGRVEALCRGCKRPQSPLLAASEWFALGEYVLYAGKGRMSVQSCQLTESFYPLRVDYERLKYATYTLSVAEAATQPGEKSVDLFTLLARTLYRLSYRQLAYEAVTAAFLLHFASISGYRPRLSHCARCGKETEEADARAFDIEGGGVLCSECREGAQAVWPVTLGQMTWMRDVLKRGIDQTQCPPQDAPGALLAAYVETRLEKALHSKGLWHL